VVVITGAGEPLMRLASLATIAAKQPRNLTIVVLDNGHFGETGMQRSHTSLGTDLVAVAKGFGIADAFTVDSVEMCGEIAKRAKARQGTAFVRVTIDSNEPPRALPPRDGVYIKNRFRGALGLKPF
jgi:thiamine pyrophosphate-dependent acetolactate synthase large subunit-like protein